MPTTSNFGWTTPADTDLVKDGASAIRTLGNGIDASMAELKGGTTGQILSKTSNTDMDFTWINNDQGDITAVTAGTGISGGGTSGAVTITNSMATEITAAGDIIIGTGSGTFDNLPIGTTGQVLTADTTVSPYKVKWATASSGATFVGVRAYKNATQSISDSTATAVTYAAESYDSDGFHDNSTNNSRFTVPTGKGGYYLCIAQNSYANAAGGSRATNLRINGTTYTTQSEIPGASSGRAAMTYAVDVLNLSAGDYVEVMAYQTSGGSLNLVNDGTNISYFSMVKVG